MHEITADNLENLQASTQVPNLNTNGFGIEQFWPIEDSLLACTKEDCFHWTIGQT